MHLSFMFCVVQAQLPVPPYKAAGIRLLSNALQVPIIMLVPFHPWLYVTESIYYTDTQQLL